MVKLNEIYYQKKNTRKLWKLQNILVIVEYYLKKKKCYCNPNNTIMVYTCYILIKKKGENLMARKK